MKAPTTVSGKLTLEIGGPDCDQIATELVGDQDLMGPLDQIFSIQIGPSRFLATCNGYVRTGYRVTLTISVLGEDRP